MYNNSPFTFCSRPGGIFLIKRIFIVFLLGLLFSFSALSEQTQMRRQTTDYFGTVCALFLYESEDQTSRFENAWAQTKAILAQVENAVSLSVPDSDIARFNALPEGGRMEISPITAEILSIAFEAYEETGGLYDPTVYPLVDLWGFSPRFNTNNYRPILPYDRTRSSGVLPPPDDAHINALLPLVGLNGILLEERNGAYFLTKTTPSVQLCGADIHAQLDLGGIAKGYACDQIKQMLISLGYEHGHFVCGDSSVAVLSRPTEDGLYTLTLGKPRSGSTKSSHYATVSLRDITLSTSSDSRHSFTYDAVRYCHIIDPRTGYPINMPHDGSAQKGPCSVTLLGQSAARSDALTTALCLMQPQDAMQFMQSKLPDDEVIMALYHAQRDTLEVITTLNESRITLNDSAYCPVSAMIDGHLVYTGTFFP